MNYGKLLSDAWNLVWNNKYLILLGVLVVLGSAGSGSSSQGFSGDSGVSGMRGPDRFDLPSLFNNGQWPNLALGAVAGLAVIAVLAAVVFWVLGAVGRGGLIFGADTASRGEQSNFSSAFRSGWNRIWRLVGIGLIPMIPVLFLGIMVLIGVGVYGGVQEVLPGEISPGIPNAGFLLPVVGLGAIILAVTLALLLLRTFAERACMLDNLGVAASYQKGGEVLIANLGPAILLFLLQIAVSLGIGIVLLLPGAIISLCCLLWPVLLLVQGTFAAFYSSLWTLAWNQWTGSPAGITATQDEIS